MKVWIFRKLTVILFIIAAFLLQTTYLDCIRIAHTIPNLLVILVVAFGFIMGTSEGFIAGITAGILMDAMFSEKMGVYALIFITIGYIAGVFAKIYYGNAKLVMYALTFVLEIGYGLYMYVVFYLLRGRLYIFTYFIRNILPSAIYTLALCFLVGPILIALNNKFIQYKRRNDNYFAKLDS